MAEPKQALVTGCSRGIGHAVTEMLLAAGWEVFGVSRTKPPGLIGKYVGFAWMSADVGLSHQVSRLGFYVPGQPIGAVIHCAGIRGPHGSFAENDPSEWLTTVRTNLLGAYHVSRLALALMDGASDGRLLLFSGGGAFNASPGHSAYAVAKAGVVSLMETLAEELRGSTVTVNCVAPGPIPTAMTASELPDDGGHAMAKAVACVEHLLSPAARGLTGKTISAVHDDWASLSALTVDAVNASPMGTRARHNVQLVANLAAYRTRKVI